jgi:hypothetical protein
MMPFALQQEMKRHELRREEVVEQASHVSKALGFADLRMAYVQAACAKARVGTDEHTAEEALYKELEAHVAPN